MELHIGRHVSKYDLVAESKAIGFRLLLLLPGASRVQGLLMNSFLKLLFIPVLFALSTYASDYSDVQSLRTVLDPVLRKIPGVEGSMIGACVKGTDKDPFKMQMAMQGQGNQSIDLCLVYFIKDETLIPRARNIYKRLNVDTSIAVRFQKI